MGRRSNFPIRPPVAFPLVTRHSSPGTRVGNAIEPVRRLSILAAFRDGPTEQGTRGGPNCGPSPTVVDEASGKSAHDRTSGLAAVDLGIGGARRKEQKGSAQGNGQCE